MDRQECNLMDAIYTGAIVGAVIGMVTLTVFNLIYKDKLFDADARSGLILIIFILIAAIIWLVRFGLRESDCRCDVLICVSFLLLIVILLLMWVLEICNNKEYILLIAPIGITALIIPLILSISSKYNIGSKLDSGEVRKSIVISLTIIYIIFLVISFQQSLKDPSKSDGNYHAFINMTTDGSTTAKENRMMIVNINSTSEGVLQVIPVTATANVSEGTVQITPMLSAKTGAEDGGAEIIPLTGGNSTVLPADAISSFTKNFLWVYALIISFYFGSRIWEEKSDKNSMELFMTEKKSPLEIAKIRYSTGNLGSREFEKIGEDLKEPEPAKIEIDNAFFFEFDKKLDEKCDPAIKLAVITVRNLTKEPIKLLKIYVDDVLVKHSGYDTVIEGMKSKTIKLSMKNPNGENRKYNIKIAIEGSATEHKTIEIPEKAMKEIQDINPEFLEELKKLCTWEIKDYNAET